MTVSLCHRRGFVLLAVLWVMVGVAVLALTVSLSAREAVQAVRNRIDLSRAEWRAEDCLSRARAVVDDALMQSSQNQQAPGWLDIDRILASSALLRVDGCDLSAHAAGTLVDVNTADRETLESLFAAAGVAMGTADSLADALLDWRDPDDVPRPYGAERQWYAAHRRPLPRNGTLADTREIRRVRGFERSSDVASLMSVEPGRICINRAPLVVLAALPGFSSEIVQRVAELRARGQRLGSLMALRDLDGLSPAARDSLQQHFAALARAATTEPDAWIVVARGRSGAPPIYAVIELRLVRAGRRAAVVRRRTWIP